MDAEENHNHRHDHLDFLGENDDDEAEMESYQTAVDKSSVYILRWL